MESGQTALKTNIMKTENHAEKTRDTSEDLDYCLSQQLCEACLSLLTTIAKTCLSVNCVDRLRIGLINHPGYKHDVNKHSASHRQKGTILEVTASELNTDLQIFIKAAVASYILLH